MSSVHRPPGAHGSWVLADDAVLAAVKALTLGRVDHPPRLGRYEVEGPLGAGAMGRLFLARDPQLDRKVALKLVAPELVDDPVARERFVREARAMAKLSEPHVAQVYEVAETDEHLLVAMEFVDGLRLGDWLRQEPRPWRAIVEVFVQAGQGLAAVHDKGLVHRDFKPDNVMLERQGRAKVVDFGLACDFGEADLESTPSPEAPASLTTTGAWLGTPAYMAPEQWEGGRVDARSDQFSFCVALYEALAERRPFEGESAGEVRRALERGRIEALPKAKGVPRRIEAAIVRGLSLEPRDRWPSMEALLHAIAPRSRSWTSVWLPAVAVVAVGTTWLLGSSDRCADAGAAIDEHWSAVIRDRAGAAMAEASPPWVAETQPWVLAGLDRAAAGWREAAQAVCAAGEQRAESRACLEHTRARLVEAFERAPSSDPAILVDAALRAELLPDARACLQPAAVAWLRDATLDPAHAERAAGAWWEATRRYGELSTQAGAGHYVASLAAGRAAAARARAEAGAAGDRPRMAAAAWLVGRLALRDTDRETAERSLREAMELAIEVDDTALRAAAAVELVYVVGSDRERGKDAEALADDAQALLSALGDPPLLSARLAAHRASLLLHGTPHRPEAAVALHREALASLRQHLGESHPEVLVERGNLGVALGYTDAAEEAELHLRDAIARAQRVWGPEHPRTAGLQGALGSVLARHGDLEGAREALEVSLRTRAAALGEDHDAVADARYNLAQVMRRQGEHEAAIEQLRAGLATRERLRGPHDAGHAEWLTRIGISELTVGRLQDARASLHRALGLRERFGGTPNQFGNLRVALARTYAREDPAKARVFVELARRDWHDNPTELANLDTLSAELAAIEAELTAPRPTPAERSPARPPSR